MSAARIETLSPARSALHRQRRRASDGPVVDLGKHDVLGIRVDAVDYQAAVDGIIAAAKDQRPYAVTALAVHGVMEGVLDREQGARLNALDRVVPDGQPVRWALNALYGVGLADRVYGPTLTLEVCERAAELGLPVYFYGSHARTVAALARNLAARFPGLIVAGAEPSRFGSTTADEQLEIADRINASGARVCFVGLGCPRQEVFAYEYRDLLNMPVIAVGAAFDYHGGGLREPPEWVQRLGLQWLVRLAQDPRRLWRRYLILGPRFVRMVASQRLGRARHDSPGHPPARSLFPG